VLKWWPRRCGMTPHSPLNGLQDCRSPQPVWRSFKTSSFASPACLNGWS